MTLRTVRPRLDIGSHINARPELLPEAGAERTLEAASSRPLFGPDVASKAQKAGVSASGPGFLSPASQAGDDGGKGVYIWLEDDVIGDAPAFPVRLESLDHLVHRPNEDVGALEDLLGA
jgi:hypothetical protein